MQIMRSADGLFSRKGLNWIDRMSLMETLLYWMGSFPFRLACLLVPILYWLTGLTVMDAPIGELATFLLPRILVEDRKSVVSGKSVSVRVDLGGRRVHKNKKHNNHKRFYNAARS